MRRVRDCPGLAPTTLALLAAVLAVTAAGAESPAVVHCGPGERVQGDMGGGGPGTIAEIGSVAPHVGWYRIVFGWSPAGEWYDPAMWKVYREGSQQRCTSQRVEGNASASAAVATGSRAGTAAGVAAGSPPASDGARSSGHAAAPPTRSTARCSEGSAVLDRQGREVVVMGENNGLCVVRYADGRIDSILHWMLSPRSQDRAATAAGSAAGQLTAGRYVCSMPGAGQFLITLEHGGTYRDRADTVGRYRVTGDHIVFESGSLQGEYSRILGAGKFGLSSDQDRMFYGVCNLKR